MNVGRKTVATERAKKRVCASECTESARGSRRQRTVTSKPGRARRVTDVYLGRRRSCGTAMKCYKASKPLDDLDDTTRRQDAAARNSCECEAKEAVA
jgi:hypothetical protein